MIRGGVLVMRRVFIVSLVILLFVVTLFGCGGLRYSQVAPEAKNFHPKAVGVLPVDVGTYEEARGVIDQVIAGVLVDTQWFTDVVAADIISNQLQSNEELRKVYLDYISKLKAVNFSDPEMSKKIGEISKVEAFLVINVDYWNYTKENEKKVAKVGIGIKMIDASSGKILWKAGHHEAEDYMLIKPKLPDVAKDLVKKMIKEMPH
jgi:TolB-like protein